MILVGKNKYIKITYLKEIQSSNSFINSLFQINISIQQVYWVFYCGKSNSKNFATDSNLNGPESMERILARRRFPSSQSSLPIRYLCVCMPTSNRMQPLHPHSL